LDDDRLIEDALSLPLGDPKRRPAIRSLMRRGTMEQAKRHFIRFLRACGDVGIATNRISRSPGTVLGYRAQDAVFAAEWDDAQRFHNDLLAERLQSMGTKAVDVIKEGLEQKDDRRLAVAIAEKRVAKMGLESPPEMEAMRRTGPAVSVIVIMEQGKPDAIMVDAERDRL
jgi:hypothetical protein